MTLSDDIKAKIQAEYDSWKDKLWAGKTKEERQKLGQFATPPSLTIKMLEKFETLEDKDILDPCLGAGNLIAAAIIAGADPSMCYGIELDNDILHIAKRRLAQLGVPPDNLIQGDALDPQAYERLVPFKHDVFAIVGKHDNIVMLTIVKNGKASKTVEFASNDRNRLKDVLGKIKNKGIKICKI